MKRFGESVVQAVVAGALLIAPIYLAVLMLLKAMRSLEGIVRPLARLLPKSFPAEPLISLLVVLILCLMVGILLRTPFGKATRSTIDNSLLQKIPGYELFRSLTRQLAGVSPDSAWKPALAEIEDAFVPAFIVDQFDGGFAVFVPSAPTPLTGAIYILSAERVHPLEVSFAQAVNVIARWGLGSKALVSAMQSRRTSTLVTK